MGHNEYRHVSTPRPVWTAVRVTADTKAKLQELRELWEGMEMGALAEPLGTPKIRSGKVSKRDQTGLDQVIRRLIRLWERHTERSNAAAKSKSKKTSK